MCVLDYVKAFKTQIRKRNGAILTIVLINLVVAVGIIAGGGTRLAQERSEVIVKVSPAEPIPPNTVGVDTFELSNPPRRAGGDLLVEHSIFVDIYGLRRQAILLLGRNEPAICRNQVSTAAFHMPAAMSFSHKRTKEIDS